MEHLKIEYLPIARLKPYDKNAKEHPQEQIDQIIASIREFGMNDPIAIWSDECLVVEGHGRLLALQQMGETEAPTIRLDHMSDEQRRAYTLAHNKITMNSGFDLEMLHAELEELDIDMSDFGFDEPSEIEWDTVDDLGEDTYEEPVKDQLECPNCHHVDSKNRFKKVEGVAAGDAGDDE